MKKSKGVISLLLVTVLTGLLVFTTAVGFGSGHIGAAKNIKLGLDLAGGVSITYQAKGEKPTEKEMSDTVYKLQKRVEQYSTEAGVYQEGDDRISIEIPGVTDANKVLEELGKPGSLEFQDSEGNVVLDGTDVKSATAQIQEDNSGNKKNMVSLEMTKEGKKKFAEATEKNLGKPISIVYDGQVISSPTVNSAITNGQAVIEGSFTYEEAEERTILMQKIYKDFIEESLAIPLVAGKKTDSEKFAGAEDTYTVEALMYDGKALQAATSHFFGSGFADAFDIKYLDKNNELHSVYETSWGLTTRMIGAIIMVHGDDSGLVLPPRIAPVQTRVIPIAQHKEGVLEKATELMNTLKAAGYAVNMDSSDKSPGWKFSEQEMQGIPTRIEIGPKDIENNQVVVVRRDTREKIVVSLDEITTKLGEILETIQKDMFDKAKAFLDSHIDTAVTMDEMIEKFQENRGFIKAMWCGDEACEDEIKAQTGGASSRCIPPEQEHLSDVCICCGKPAKHMVYWGKSY